jgi:hypothetical protein
VIEANGGNIEANGGNNAVEARILGINLRAPSLKL